MKVRKRYFAYLVLLLGIGCLAYPPVMKYWNDWHDQQVVDHYLKHPQQQSLTKYDALNQRLLHTQTVSSNLQAESSDDRDVFGVLTIPKISSRLPIYLGASNEHLLKGVGQVAWSSYPVGGKNTHSVLAGHSGYADHRLFSNLDQVTVGDRFTIQVGQRKLTYQVTKTVKINVNQLDYFAIQPNRDLVSLVTCTQFDYDRYRFVVTGERVAD